MNPLAILTNLRFQDVIDILFLTFVAYHLYLWFWGTKAFKALVGLLVLGTRAGTVGYARAPSLPPPCRAAHRPRCVGVPAHAADHRSLRRRYVEADDDVPRRGCPVRFPGAPADHARDQGVERSHEGHGPRRGSPVDRHLRRRLRCSLPFPAKTRILAQAGMANPRRQRHHAGYYARSGSMGATRF